MSLLDVALIALSCSLFGSSAPTCIEPSPTQLTVAGQEERIVTPVLTGESTDVVLTAEAAYVWDVATGKPLYDKNSDTRRPIASITKLLSALTVVENASLDETVEISSTAANMRRVGASIELPSGHHTTVRELLAASMIASANDAIVALAEHVAGSEVLFVEQANRYAAQHALPNTQIANASGLSGGEQFSTAHDVQRLMTQAFEHPVIGPLLAEAGGTLQTMEGATRRYESTNKLLKTYIPIQAAKTGYTVEAGENLVIITRGAQGQQVGAVILGSGQRFQDMKILIEWIWRNYTW